MYQEFTIETLSDFADGKVAESFNRKLRDAVRDCMDRPAEKSVRSVDVSLEVLPVLGQDGIPLGVTVKVKLGSKVPKFHSAPVHCNAKASGQLLFNDMAPDNPSQTTIDE